MPGELPRKRFPETDKLLKRLMHVLNTNKNALSLSSGRLAFKSSNLQMSFEYLESQDLFDQSVILTAFLESQRNGVLS